MFKKVNLIYFSATKVSQKYARAVGYAFSRDIEEYDITFLSNRKVEKAPRFTSDELVIIAMPVYAGRVIPLCEDYIKALEGNGAACIIMATYGNREFDDALVEMQDLMTAAGFEIIGAAACVGRHSFSDEIAGKRPTAEDLAEAASFAEAIKAKGRVALERKAVPGSRPYKDRSPANGFAPSTLDTCMNCKVCAINCPNGVISMDNPKILAKDASACQVCNRCVQLCPVKAKVFTADAYAAMVASCIERFAKPDKKNLFIV